LVHAHRGARTHSRHALRSSRSRHHAHAPHPHTRASAAHPHPHRAPWAVQKCTSIRRELLLLRLLLLHLLLAIHRHNLFHSSLALHRVHLCDLLASNTHIRQKLLDLGRHLHLWGLHLWVHRAGQT
jgi:hypothetical protein